MLLETFLELLLYNSFQCHRHIFVNVFNVLQCSYLKGSLYFLEAVRSHV